MTKKKSQSLKLSMSRSQEVLFGAFLMLFALLCALAMVSYLSNWKADFTTINDWSNRVVETQNILKKFGAHIAHFLIFKLFGIASFILVALVFISGLTLFVDAKKSVLWHRWSWGLPATLWFALFFAFILKSSPLMGGVVGFEINAFLYDYIGAVGIMALLLFGFLLFLVINLKWTPEKLLNRLKSESKSERSTTWESEQEVEVEMVNEETEKKSAFEVDTSQFKPTIEKSSTIAMEKDAPEEKNNLAVEIEKSFEEDVDENTTAKKLVENFGEFDPTLELKNFKPPTLELLKEYTQGSGITINQEELEENKERIVETLSNYKIGIAQIKATIGPTVTLYEIVPDAGIRISKIKNLEDDIALSLSALGIRIIAPIPGKGTIGIEVPNKNATLVSMRSVIASSKFQEAEMELPIALGKTISNETFVFDLAKMPHLLMAGATGQGKSVGLNAVLTSLLYKKHPSEVKFVLVDPKKVELTLYNKIERHYLAKLPDTEEAIITDNKLVINTLNSLCIEMDERYEMLKNAFCRNIKEYNKKFKSRKLNPENGFRFLPYIVLVIDEFADLIMTAGKEVETPIARLAQLARAIGIHLIIATQRPSVNVITGLIKANFPARVAFRVTSRIDSRTILDQGGADQLIGRGDMLFTQGNELTRLQCAFVDTPEVEKITGYIGAQRAYPSAFELPEYVGDETGTSLDNNIEDRDPLFNEAAEVVVTAQQGSASLLQRKMKLGYNRAGRIVDQLEAAGIVGPFEGSKARDVLVKDLVSLKMLLDDEQNP